jgi:hypothetical protein
MTKNLKHLQDLHSSRRHIKVLALTSPHRMRANEAKRKINVAKSENFTARSSKFNDPKFLALFAVMLFLGDGFCGYECRASDMSRHLPRLALDENKFHLLVLAHSIRVFCDAAHAVDSWMPATSDEGVLI